MRPRRGVARLLQHSGAAFAMPASIFGSLGQKAGPSTSRLSLHLQQEWDQATWPGSPHTQRLAGPVAFARLGSCTSGSLRFMYGQMATVTPSIGRAVCPCNDLAYDHADVAAEWDWEGNRTRH